MCGFELTAQAPLSLGDTREEAVFEMPGHERAVLEVCDRFPLSVQHALNPFDDVLPMVEEEVKEFEVRLERHLGQTGSGRPVFGRKQWRKSQAIDTILSSWIIVLAVVPLADSACGRKPAGPHWSGGVP